MHRGEWHSLYYLISAHASSSELETKRGMSYKILDLRPITKTKTG